MRVRQSIHLGLVVFVCVVAGSFLYGGYLKYSQRTGLQTVIPTPAPSETIDQLIRTAETNLENKHIEQALIGYRKAMSLVPDSVQAQLGLALGELKAGREAVAAQEYERVLRLDGRSAVALLQLARIYSHQRDTWARSEAKFKEYLRVKPGDAEAQLQLARVFVWQRKAKEGAEVFSLPAVSALMTPQDFKEYAFALVRAGREKEGEALLRKLVVQRPADSEIHEQLASIYASRKDWDSALPIYESLLQRDPNNARWNLTYGGGLLASHKYAAALAPLEKAVRTIPSNGEAGLALARAWKGSGNLKKSSQEFARVLPQYDNDAAIVREYADLLLEKRDYRGAEKSYKDAMKLGLRDQKLILGLAGALQGSGKNREALPFLREAFAAQPTDRLGLELARTLRKLGYSKEALEVLAKVEPTQN
jgi:tetratricopeptide (TPR) repeat protein